MRRIFARWPECPPYAGTIAAEDVVPHLTVCDSVTGDHLDRVELALAGGLPIRTRLAEAWLIERAAERWTTRHRFVLG
jgi:hypothetical protein